MSGTTAISSFSMVEAEFLDPKYIMKHLRKLCDSAEEFLDFLVPADGNIDDDIRSIREIQKPDSDFTEEYRDFDIELNVHLKHYKSEEQNYIHVRAIHRALFRSNGEAVAARSGLDLILYLANLVVFTKQMIHSDRGEKFIWDALRQLDNTFPSHFMHSLVHEEQSPSAGQSKLVDETYDLALDLRTQLAILVLKRSYDNTKANSDDIIEEVFFRSDFSQEEGGPPLRGWDVSVVDGEEAALPPHVHDLIIKRIHQIQEYFYVGDEALEESNNALLEDLENDFPWVATVMRILHWARLRHKELQAVMHNVGGAVAILHNVKGGIEIQSVVEQVGVPSVVRDTPRKKRTSFGRDRRRSSRKFNPNAPVDLRTIDALKAKEQYSGIHVKVGPTPQEPEEQPVDHAFEEAHQERTLVEDQVPADDQQQANGQQIVEVEERTEEPVASGPPTNPADLLKVLKAVSNPQKENRPVSIFDRQITAQRVEFGDGFDETQPTPGPSNKGRGKQPAQSSPRKRSRPIDLEEESDDDAFETEGRGARVPAQRRKAPVAKKVRIDPASSGVPPSHQPRGKVVDNDYVPQPQEHEESVSEAESPDMTEEAPPSTYQSQHRLAQQNSGILRVTNSRKPRTGWSNEEEEAFAAYMALYPAKYATILQYDKDEGNGVLQDRTQVNLKDKARTMAVNMIK